MPSGILADMGRSGTRERALAAILGADSSAAAAPTMPRIGQLPAETLARILELFDELGGVGDLASCRPGGWDMVLPDGTVVEFDERQHFTPYRAATLAPRWAAEMPWTDQYLELCREHENDAWASFLWAATPARRAATTPVPERLFGDPAPRGDYRDGGSPRGKQRAIYDAVRDALAANGDIALVRLSIYDHVEGAPLGNALTSSDPVDRGALDALIASRTIDRR